MKKYISSLLALSVATLAGAQGLNKEITIEKEIVPEQRAATRLLVTHSLISPKVNKTIPTFSSTGVNAEIAPDLHLLDPASTADELVPSPYRGYASVGYFPSYNLGASAGYRVIDNARTRLGAWLQFNGYSYDRTALTDMEETDDKTKVSDNSFKLGVDFARNLTSTGVLSANLNLGYGKSRFNDIDRSATQFSLDANWKAAAGDVNYKIGAFGGYFGNSMNNKDIFKPFNQTTYGGVLGAEYLGISLDVTALMTSNSRDVDNDDTENPGLVRLNPTYTYKNSNLLVRLGFKADFNINSDKNFRIAPDVKFEYRFVPAFGFYAVADGGVKVNTMESIYDYSHFVSPEYIYGNSFVPMDLRGGFIIGPYRGFSAEVFAGYAKADNWLMAGYSVMDVEDVKAMHAGAALKYNFRDIVAAKASVEFAQSSGNKAYYLWRDRAKTVADITVEAHPIKKLTLEAGWELRTGRRLGDEIHIFAEPEDRDLGNVSNLSFGAAYRITEPFTVFARGENLLAKKWDLMGGLPANGVCGLVGVSYKF